MSNYFVRDDEPVLIPERCKEVNEITIISDGQICS